MIKNIIKYYILKAYTNMLEGKKYILYLELAEEGYYIPLALTAGKVPHNKF